MSVIRLLLAATISPTDIGLPNSTANVGQIITNVIKFLMGVIGLASVAFIVFGGFKITTSAGDPGKYKAGRETLTYAIIGLIVAIGAYAIVSFIASRLG